MSEQFPELLSSSKVTSLDAWKAEKQQKQASANQLERDIGALSGKRSWQQHALHFADSFPSTKHIAEESEDTALLHRAIETVSRYNYFLKLQVDLGLLDEQLIDELSTEFEGENLEDLANRLSEITPQIAKDKDTYLYALAEAFKRKYFMTLEQIRTLHGEL